MGNSRILGQGNRRFSEVLMLTFRGQGGKIFHYAKECFIGFLDSIFRGGRPRQGKISQELNRNDPLLGNMVVCCPPIIKHNFAFRCLFNTVRLVLGKTIKLLSRVSRNNKAIKRQLEGGNSHSPFNVLSSNIQGHHGTSEMVQGTSNNTTNRRKNGGQGYSNTLRQTNRIRNFMPVDYLSPQQSKIVTYVFPIPNPPSGLMGTTIFSPRPKITLHVESKNPVQVFLTNEDGLNNYNNRKPVSTVNQVRSDNTFHEEINLPRGGIWYLIIYNPGSEMNAIYFYIWK